MNSIKTMIMTKFLHGVFTKSLLEGVSGGRDAVCISGHSVTSNYSLDWAQHRPSRAPTGS